MLLQVHEEPVFEAEAQVADTLVLVMRTMERAAATSVSKSDRGQVWCEPGRQILSLPERYSGR